VDEAAESLGTNALVCVECLRAWTEPKERWRTYLTDDQPPETATYCPDCAAREFDF
jgi:hypothetical protein